MEMKPFVIGMFITVGTCCSMAYADLQIDNQGHVVQKILSANTTTTDTTQQIIGTGASGESHSATMDQNGRWQAPESSSQATPTVPLNNLPQNSSVTTSPSAVPPSPSVTTPNATVPSTTTVTTPSGTTVVTPGNATVKPDGSSVTIPGSPSVIIQDKTR